MRKGVKRFSACIPLRLIRSTVECVAVLLDDRACLVARQEFEEGRSGRIGLSGLQENGILTDRLEMLLRDHPARAGIGLGYLTQRDEAHFGIAGLDELIG